MTLNNENLLLDSIVLCLNLWGEDSAGGNLAEALTIILYDFEEPLISFQPLFVPATDIRGNKKWPSYDEAGEKDVFKNF